MPFDGSPRWEIEIAAADKTAAAFSSVERRMKGLQQNQAMMAQAMATGTTSAASLARSLLPMAAGYMAVAKAQEIWARAMKAGDLGEQAEQLGVNTDQLQAYRYAGAQAGIETGQMDVALTKLAKTMGAAADGGKEQIELFQRLGVKLLDSRGELRATADVLPEVAKGVLGIGSSSQRTATLMDLFGKSGSKMATVLEEIAKGNDLVVDSAKQAGAIASPEVIQAWDNYSDAMKRAELQADVTYAKLGAPIATAGLNQIAQALASISGLMDQINSKEGFWASVLNESRAKGQIGSGPGALRLETPAQALERKREALEKELRSGAGANDGREAMIRADLERLKSGDVVSGQYYGEDMAGAASRGMRATPINRGSGGSRNPGIKGAGASEAAAYQKIIDGAKDYISAKNAETAAIGLNAEAAARLVHFTELQNKATGENKTLTAAQTEQLQALAAKMAEADSAFASGKFMDEAKKKSEEFIATQQTELEALFMSTEAAAAYRIEQELINKALADGINLTGARRDEITAMAAAQAAAGERTRQTKELVEVGRDAIQGFFSDIRQGAQEGKSALEIFGDAFVNMLNKVADKLISMAVNNLIDNALGGTKGGGSGGLLGSLGSWFGGLFGFGGGVTAGAAPTGGYGGYPGYANTLPGFAGGGDTPAYRPFIVGENGPELMWNKTRGHIANRRQVAGMGGGDVQVVINNNYANSAAVSAKKSQGADGTPRLEILVEQLESTMAGRMSRGQGTLSKTMTGLYGPPIAR